MIKTRLLDIRQKKQERDFQIAWRMATTRERVYWLAGFYTTMGVVSMAKMIYQRRIEPLPLSFLPYVLVPFVFFYQLDFAYGTKSERLKVMTDKILNEEPHHWFNQPIELPDLLKPYYTDLMHDQNQELEKLGKPLQKDWAK
eukprot:TRINITY_DN5949_c0_g1_i1.p1 TRINITY_DN5949_c0_g1~~TRINITY_DN5949_c0_g1_i1.p1  ORF type:complete len:162 (-),score=19.91 TRINITY_DN5949_c0_g1_i1:14-439(-)